MQGRKSQSRANYDMSKISLDVRCCVARVMDRQVACVAQSTLFPKIVTYPAIICKASFQKIIEKLNSLKHSFCEKGYSCFGSNSAEVQKGPRHPLL